MFLGAAARSVVIVWLPSAVIDTVVCIPYRGFSRGVLQGLLRGNNRSLDLPTRGDIFAYAKLSTFADCDKVGGVSIQATATVIWAHRKRLHPPSSKWWFMWRTLSSGFASTMKLQKKGLGEADARRQSACSPGRRLWRVPEDRMF